jgi:2-hydroxychromene-2-carboxylate isomerase
MMRPGAPHRRFAERIVFMAKLVDYYFSPMSPWTYLGHGRFAALLPRYGAQVKVKPVDYAKIFPVSGGLPLKQRAAQRQAYRLVELRRFRDHVDVPLNLEPKFFPVSTDDAAMLIIAADQEHGASAAMSLAGAILRACWAEERNIGDAQTLAQIAAEQGLNASALEDKQPQARAAYDAYTQEAIERQVFGAPTYVLDGEPFWGQDRLDFLERALAR